MVLESAGEVGILMMGAAALVAAIGYVAAVRKRWSYRAFRREKEWLLARAQLETELIDIPDDPRKKMIAAYREALDRLDDLEVRLRAVEGPEPDGPRIGFMDREL